MADKKKEVKIEVIIELSIKEHQVLSYLEQDSYLCYSYGSFCGDLDLNRKDAEKIIKTLRTLGLVEYHRGLMDDDGQVAGSGFCRSKAGNEVIEKYGMDSDVTWKLNRDF